MASDSRMNFTIGARAGRMGRIIHLASYVVVNKKVILNITGEDTRLKKSFILMGMGFGWIQDKKVFIIVVCCFLNHLNARR
mmetsp:Transcript_24984/g.61527  ORF Transcript_24984/g.61527 Transcript_24984/m.61527 type:complete len:81 (+) Transcript_24984:1246-1488(+)